MIADSPILLVDDDQPLRRAIADALRDEGYRVDEASDGVEALTACVRDRPSLVITDCQMPHMTGPELVMRLAADPRFAAMPVIVMSGTEAELSSAIAGFLEKPFSISQLLSLVRSCDVHPDRRAG